MNFFFHGASVTQQSGASSYFDILSRRIGSSHNLNKKGYGGCHFNDAGFLTLRTDLPNLVDVCVLEWNTTGLNEFNLSKLDFVVGYLLDRKVFPVFLILARKDNFFAPRVCDLQILKFCSDKNILCLDYRNKINPELHLRDIVHTNELGAAVYAQNLFLDLFSSFDYMNEYAPLISSYRNFLIDSHRGLILDALEGDRVIIELDEISNGSQVIFEVLIGPYSPVVDINGFSKICFWDRWCHYERSSFKAISIDISELKFNNHLILSILSDVIDYSDCAREFSFGGLKILKIRGVHGVDCLVNRISIN